ncbi:beta-ketoacyl synthase N-terminal-like domain-containing protein [Desulfuromonas acetexigens]|uniref:Type I polyketide synthase n=1 Tax=Trichloromonas acetexigens TaxID=38815 RepID=A0A550JH85_9BACT|nr:beta-ketoacyl synthase N-terminal-like domain-containing protein [Desulfuromonas acetexigens]TRO82587.1 type I polyketide synthase [Desulfuromonas acetexigens]
MKHGKSVAIVGLGGIFPDAPTLEAFWNNIVNGVNSSRRPPKGRWLLEPEEVYDQRIGAPDKVCSAKGCYIEGDLGPLPEDLAIDPDFAAGLDPLFHLLLRAGHRAFAGGKTDTLDRGRVGVIIGHLALPSESASALARDWLGRTFEERLLGESRVGPPVVAAVNHRVAGLPAGLLARALGLGGPSYTLDAACASSLYAIHLAVEELLSGRADAMLSGGLSRPDPLYTQMGFSQLHAVSPTGTCSPFDQQGDGLVVGEGCGIFLLKRTEDALRDGDRILGVIRGIGLSNDLGGSLLAPASEGQLRAMRAAYQQAGWNPSDVDLIECHATGTPVGDAVEFASLKSLWGDGAQRREPCIIGSVKSNIGHLLTAAGAAALTKVLLALQAETLPPTANFRAPAKGIDLDQSPFAILAEARPWTSRKAGRPRRAAVSAFGFGGINAHLLIEEWLPPQPSKSRVAFPPSFQRTPQPIAIVGMGAHFGPWEDLATFQRQVFGAGEGPAAASPTRWWGAEESRWLRDSGINAAALRGHFVPTVAAAPGEFRIPPKELEEMLPRQLLMLQVADEALRDAQLKGEDLLHAGVFIGTGLDLNATGFSFRWEIPRLARRWAEELGRKLDEKSMAEWIAELREAAGPPLTANRVMGGLGSIVASRIAKEFRVGGPSFTLSSEENSGLRALEVAVHALREGAVNRAVVGAVDLHGDLRAVLGRQDKQPYSPSGSCRPFQPDADGSLIGEGAAALVLKRLEDAQRDGDRIYAVIQGIGSATGGAAESSRPDRAALDLSLHRAFQEARLKPAAVDYLETHGSGDLEEDALEGAALAEFLDAGGDDRPCWIGAVKAEIGHAGHAAGLASLVRAALALHHQILPPLCPSQIDGTPWAKRKRPYRLACAPQYWLRDRAEGPRHALVSALGGDGSCSTALLEGFDGKGKTRTPSLPSPLGPLREGLFALTGDSAETLLGKLKALRELAATQAEGSLDDLARAWLRRYPVERSRGRCLTLVAGDRQELTALFDQARDWLTEFPEERLDGNDRTPRGLRDRIFYNPAPLAAEGKVAFIFPGSGNHFAGMGRDLSARWPEIHRRQDASSHYLRRQYLPQHFWGESLNEAIHEHHNALVIAQVALGTAVSDLVRGFAIEPQLVSGYSLGESAGFFSFGVWKDRDGMARRLRESTLFTEDLAGPCQAARRTWKLPPEDAVDWTLGLVAAPAEEVRQALAGEERVYLLIVNTYEECVIGGRRADLERVVKRLGATFIPLRGVTTVHCPVADQVAHRYRELHRFPTTPPEGLRFYSCALGRSYPLDENSVADAILGQALDTVDYPRVVEQLYADGARIFLEMGPGNSCTRMIGRILKDRPHFARAACYPGVDAVSLILRLLAQCLAEGLPVDVAALYPEVPGTKAVKAKTSLIATEIGGAPFAPPRPAKEESRTPAASPASAPVAVVKPPPATPPTPIPPLMPVAPPTMQAPLKAAPSATAAVLAENPLLAPLERLTAAGAEGHAAYLSFANGLRQALTENLNWHMELLSQSVQGGELPPVAPAAGLFAAIPAPSAPPAAPARPARFSREMCMEAAIGSIAKMLGPEFAEADTFPTRVRLPDEPLMLVDRIVEVEGVPRSMSHGRVVTEHDVTADRWYLDGGRIPTCIAVEAGQADLWLSGYLGIDFITRGLAVYRLLDAVVTFHRSLPMPGEIIRYDIHIDQFFRQDQTYLFRFNFEATVGGEPFLSMKNGCAGFFTAEELEAGKGIVHTKFDLLPQPGKLPADWRELVPMAKEAYSAAQVDAIYAGDLAGAFGPRFAHLDIGRPQTLPGGRLKLVDRVIELDPTGGRYGLGQIRAEMDIRPDAWFLTCHFVDDRVMPGTLMYECCMHTLRIYLLRMGWVGAAGETWCEPMPGVASGLKCRGQVIETTKVVTYQVSIKELGYGPEPFAIVDALMFADGKAIVEIPNMSVRLAGLTREKVENLWRSNEPSVGAIHETPLPSPTPGSVAGRRPALYDYEKILAFSAGNPSEAFGEPYRIFDRERRIARLPRPPFQFLDRIVAIDGEPWKLVPGVTIEAEYDVPADAWYFAAGRQPEMPFAVLLETGLQPCGWLAAYLGSALTSDIDLRFRNLDGNAVQHRPVTPQSGTLTTKVKITRISSSGGMIIQSYDFEISDAQGPVYTGDTVFGFFSAASLAQQVGVRDARPYQPSAEEMSRGEAFPYPVDAPFPDTQLRMVDAIELFVADGGPQGLGFIRGTKRVDPGEWFFQAHFYQDPVCPGSLGLESFLQLLKVVAVRRWGGTPATRLETVAQGMRHQWNYRGQIIPENQKITIEAVVTAVDDARHLLTADGYLTVDGKVIYQMKDFSLRWS